MTAPTEAPRQIVIVGASLAGLSAAHALRDVGYEGRIILIGDENEPPYDRPPLSKQVLRGLYSAETSLPQRADWTPRSASGSVHWGSIRSHIVSTSRTAHRSYTTGCLSRPGLGHARGRTVRKSFLERVHASRPRGRRASCAWPRRETAPRAHHRGGFIGCEIASCCRDLGPRRDPGGARCAPVGSCPGFRHGRFHAGRNPRPRRGPPTGDRRSRDFNPTRIAGSSRPSCATANGSRPIASSLPSAPCATLSGWPVQAWRFRLKASGWTPTAASSPPLGQLCRMSSRPAISLTGRAPSTATASRRRALGQRGRSSGDGSPEHGRR